MRRPHARPRDVSYDVPLRDREQLRMVLHRLKRMNRGENAGAFRTPIVWLLHKMDEVEGRNLPPNNEYVKETMAQIWEDALRYLARLRLSAPDGAGFDRALAEQSVYNSGLAQRLVADYFIAHRNADELTYLVLQTRLPRVKAYIFEQLQLDVARPDGHSENGANGAGLNLEP